MQNESDKEVPILIGDMRCKNLSSTQFRYKLSDFVVYKELLI